MKYPTPQQGDAPWQTLTESRLTGMDDSADPLSLPQGMVSRAVNVRFDQGEPRSRGAAVAYRELQPQERTNAAIGYAGGLIQAGATAITWHQQGRGLHTLALWPGELADTGTSFTEASNGSVLLWRSGGKEPLYWMGGVTDVWTPASAVRTPEAAEYLAPIPAARFGASMGDRVLFPIPETDEIGFSDISEPVRWDPALSRIRVNFGEGGEIVALHAWRRQTLVILKDRSIYALSGVQGNVLENAQLDRITDEIGCVARATVTGTGAEGGDVLWLGDGGVYRLSEVMENSVQARSAPVSLPVQSLMRRVNWQAAGGACAVLAGRLWYLALPVDGSTQNNCLLVYDVVLGTWQGQDVFPTKPRIGMEPEINIRALALVRAQIDGRPRAVLVDRYWTLALDLPGRYDIITGKQWPIAGSVQYRAFPLAAGMHTPRQIIVDVETCGVQDARLDAQFPGSLTVCPVARAPDPDPSKYLAFGRAPFDLTNPQNSFAEPGRADYTWTAGDDAKLKSAGIPVQQLQKLRLGGRVQGRVRWVQPGVSWSAGAVRLKAVTVQGVAAADHPRQQ